MLIHSDVVEPQSQLFISMHGLVCIGTCKKNIEDLKDQKKKTEIIEVRNE